MSEPAMLRFLLAPLAAVAAEPAELSEDEALALMQQRCEEAWAPLTDHGDAPQHAPGELLAGRLLSSEDGIAVTVVPTVAVAVEAGLTPEQWVGVRGGLLLSVADDVQALRAAGWRLTVRSLTGADVPHPGVERVLIVEAEGLPVGTHTQEGDDE
jgi:hypothetical protein